MKAQPGTSLVRRNDTHRLIHSKYGDDGSSVLARIADSDGHLADIVDLDNATNDRLLGSRFNGPDRGAWYAAFETRTAQAEVAFHKAVELA